MKGSDLSEEKCGCHITNASAAVHSSASPFEASARREKTTRNVTIVDGGNLVALLR
jgi:hypothetical protein